jgi:hypothetical protein
MSEGYPAIEIVFVHPTDMPISLVADVSTQCTGQEILNELGRDVDGTGSFLRSLPDGQPYHLLVARTQKAISPNMTLEQAGVVGGDRIDIGISAVGAGPGSNWFELGQMVFGRLRGPRSF